MTPDRFRNLAEAYGGELSRWPGAERAAAERLLAAEPALAAVLAEASALDDLLAAVPAPSASAALAERIAASAPAPRRPRLSWAWPAGLGAGLAAACAAGLLAGVHMAERASEAEALLIAVSQDYSPYLEDDA